MLLRRWSVNSSSRGLIAQESADSHCPIKIPWTCLNFISMTHRITEIHLFHLHSTYLRDILKYFSKKYFSFFSSICWTVSNGDKDEKDKKIKESCRTKSLIYQVRKSSPPKTGIIPFISQFTYLSTNRSFSWVLSEVSSLNLDCKFLWVFNLCQECDI